MSEKLKKADAGRKPKGGRAEELSAGIRRELGDQSISAIYRLQIRPLRTRRYVLPAPIKKATVEVQHTLLGIELKIGRRRILCPDLATARFLAVFARLGVEAVALPYEITRISHLADLLESSWHRMLMLVEPATAGCTRSLRARVERLLIEHEREEVTKEGAGAAVPEFVQNTRQRRSR